MTYFVIRMKPNLEMAKEILNGWQYAVYKAKVRAFLSIIAKKLASYEKIQKGDNYTFFEEGEENYLQIQKHRLEAFLFADSSELSKDENKDFSRIKNDRIIQAVSRRAHKLKDKIKDKALATAMGGSDVIGFFARLGIMITWELSEMKPEL